MTTPTQPPAEIVIEVVYDQGGEEMGLYAKGHHDPAAMREAIVVACSGELALDMDEPPALKEIRHEWWINGPGDGGDLAFIFVQAKEGEPGAYPVTCWPLDGGMDGGPSGLASPPPPAPPETPTTATDLAGVECLLSEARSHYDSAERDEAFAALLSWARRAVERAEAAEALADRLAGELRECRSMLDALPRSHGSHRFDLIKDCVACQVAETMRTTGEALRAYDEAKKGGTTP